MRMLKMMINLNLMKESSKKLSKKKILVNKHLKAENNQSKKETKWLTTFKKALKTFLTNFIKEYQQKTNFKVLLMNKSLTAFMPHQIKLKDKINF